MSGLELNKIAAGVLVAGLLAMVAGKVADGLYHPVQEIEKRGYAVEVAEDEGAGTTAVADKPENILPLLASADLAAGEAQLRRCVACHTFEKGGANRVGPNLYGIVNADIAHLDNYAYSDAMATHGGKWDYNTLSAYLKRPREYMPGNKMAFAGLSKESDRVNLVAYLRTLSDAPAPLPSEAEIAASLPEEEPVDPAASAPAGASTADAEAEAAAEEAASTAEAQSTAEDAGEEVAPGKTPDDPQPSELREAVQDAE